MSADRVTTAANRDPDAFEEALDVLIEQTLGNANMWRVDDQRDALVAQIRAAHRERRIQHLMHGGAALNRDQAESIVDAPEADDGE